MERALNAERFTSLLVRLKVPALAIVILHGVLIHWFFLGFTSWDGLSYRVPPVIELVQHGHYGLWKFNGWVFEELVPFTELLHAPFLAAFSLPGLLIGYPAFVFPLCAAAVWLFVRELTKDERSATFSTLAWVALPVVNQQPFSGYVDFIVGAALAFLCYALLRFRAEESRRRSFFRLALATTIFTLGRTHALYIVILFFPLAAYALFGERKRWSVRVVDRAGLGLAAASVVLGSLPALALQISKLVRYGNPMYPYQFKAFGIATKTGIPSDKLFINAGIPDDSLPELGKAFVGGWIWPRSWELGAWFDSRHLGSGAVFVLAVLLTPLFFRHGRGRPLFFVGAFLLVSFLIRDFWLPRYAYAVVLSVVIVIGRALAALVESRSPAGKAAFWAANVVLFVHLARPEFDLTMLDHSIGPRLNVTGSKWFMKGPEAFDPYPDQGHKLVIVQQNWNGFLVPIYGSKMRNEIIETIPAAKLGDRCEGLAPAIAKTEGVLFIDDSNHTKDCDRECVFGIPNWCQAWRIRPK